MKRIVFFILLAAGIVLPYSRATAQPLDRFAENVLNHINNFQKILDKGEVFDPASSPAYPWINYATSASERKRYFDKMEFDAYAQKKIDDALTKLAATLNDPAIKKNNPVPAAVQFMLNDLDRITDEVTKFNASTDRYILNPADGEWLLRAVSKTARAKWAADFFKTDATGKAEFDEKLNALATAGAKAIPTFKPNASNFTHHPVEEERMIKTKLPNLAQLKIHAIGFPEMKWEIQKDAFNLPEKRYKVGYVWARNTVDDHVYCRLYQVNIIQDYMGGGTYGKTYAVYLENWLTGCK